MDEELWLILVYGLWNDKEMAESKRVLITVPMHNCSLFHGASKHPIYSAIGARNFYF